MKKFNGSLCLLAIFILGSSPSVAGTITSFTSGSLGAHDYSRDTEYFTLNGDSFLAMANSRIDANPVNSTLHKWNGSSYVLFQSFTIAGAYDWEYFTIGTDYYLAVANTDGDSEIYQWDATGDGNGGVGSGAFEPFQTIATMGARSWEFFTIDSESYLAVANYVDETDTSYNINSVIYKWDGTSQFEVFQNIETNGAHDWEFFTIGTRDYLAVANHRDTFTYNINSVIYIWNGLLFEEVQAIPTVGAQDWESFSMDGDSYLAVANHYNDTDYNINSEVYKWDGTAFVAFQTISTNGASDWEYFAVANESFLAVSNFNINTTQVFKYDGATFNSMQILSTTGAGGSAFHTIGYDSYLAVATYQDYYSKLFKAVFTPAATATIYSETPCTGQSVTLNIETWGLEPITYQWQFYDEDLVGATEDSYTIPSMNLALEGVYTCIVTNGGGTSTSNRLPVVQNPPILFEQPPVDISTCQGSTAVFALTASGLNLRYQWKNDGVVIPGAISPTYTMENITPTDESTFTCVITDACNTLTTQAVSLSVSTNDFIQLSLPQIFNVPGEQVAIPIILSGLNGAFIDGFTFSMTFDPELLEYLSHSTEDTLVDGWPVITNQIGSTVVMSGANSEPFSDDGTLIVLNFNVNSYASDGSCGEMSIDYGLLNEGEYCVASNDATFCGCLKGDATQNGSITATDATQILRKVAQLATTPAELSLCNSDATCNGTISTLDAVRILEYNVGRLEVFCATSARSWDNDVPVTIPDLTLVTNESLTIPLVLGDTTGSEIKGVAFTIDYDPKHLLITGVDPSNSLLADLDWQYEINTSVLGQVTVAAAGFAELVGSGTLLNLTASVLQVGPTELEVKQVDFNEGQPTAVLPDAPTNYRILAIDPPSVARGLQIPQLEIVGLCCSEQELMLEWRDIDHDLVIPGNPLVLDPPPQQSTVYEARITNPITLETMVRRAHVLVPVYPFTLDYNGDGYNTFDDLYMLLPDWGQPLATDPNGDGFVNVRDFLYINVQDEPNKK